MFLSQPKNGCSKGTCWIRWWRHRHLHQILILSRMFGVPWKVFYEGQWSQGNGMNLWMVLRDFGTLCTKLPAVHWPHSQGNSHRYPEWWGGIRFLGDVRFPNQCNIYEQRCSWILCGFCEAVKKLAWLMYGVCTFFTTLLVNLFFFK